MNNEIEKLSNIKSLSIQTTNQLQLLNKGQTGLLKLMSDCIKDDKMLTMDLIVGCYYDNVKKVYIEHNWKYISSDPKINTREHYTNEYNIKKEYLKNSFIWKYTLRGRIRSWLINNIGILVLKGKIIAIPIIEEI